MKLFRSIIIVLIAFSAIFSISCAPSLPAVSRQVDEQYIGDFTLDSQTGLNYRISPDNLTFAYINQVDNQQVMVINGKEQKRYTQIMIGSLAFSPDSKHIAYGARLGDNWFMVLDGKEVGGPYDSINTQVPILFSLDSQRFIYTAVRNSKTYVVVDGQELGPYDEVAYDAQVFNGDSKRYAFAATIGNTKFVICDGKQSPTYQDVSGMVFSQMGDRVAYLVARNNKWFVVLDGVEGPQYEGVSLGLFSPDGKRFVYAALSGGQQFLVDNNTEGKKYSGIYAIGFSTDNQHLYYTAMIGNAAILIEDGVEVGRYDGIDTPIFSPDSQHLVCYVVVGNKWYLLKNGKKGKGYGDIAQILPVFSNDSQKLAYIAQVAGSDDSGSTTSADTTADDKFVVVVNDKVGKQYHGIGDNSLVFSKDGKHVVYAALNNNVWYMVLDGSEIGKYDGFSAVPPQFSADGRLLVYIIQHAVTSTSSTYAMVVNANAGKTYDKIFGDNGGSVIMDSDNSFHYLALSAGKLYLVRETVSLK